jgi:hypothetical protein
MYRKTILLSVSRYELVRTAKTAAGIFLQAAH